MRRFYIDESGHGGDLIDGGDIEKQPIFALACVGVADEAELASTLERIQFEFAIPPGELKSKSLKRKLAPVAQSLLIFLAERDWPVFVEVVDKRFFLAMHLVERLLCGNLNSGLVDGTSRNMIAELLSDNDPDAVFAAYVQACRAPTLEAVGAAIDLLWDWLETRTEPVARTAQFLVKMAQARVREPDAAPSSFLPLADVGPRDKPVWILPNLQCLIGVYGRINRWSGRALSELELVHDVQLQYDGVLRHAKATLEDLVAEYKPPTFPFADYDLGSAARLRFAESTTEPSLQAADILAGFAMRYVRKHRTGAASVTPPEQAALLELLKTAHPLWGTGVNLVMTLRDTRRLEISISAPQLAISRVSRTGG